MYSHHSNFYLFSVSCTEEKKKLTLPHFARNQITLCMSGYYHFSLYSFCISCSGGEKNNLFFIKSHASPSPETSPVTALPLFMTPSPCHPHLPLPCVEVRLSLPFPLLSCPRWPLTHGGSPCRFKASRPQENLSPPRYVARHSPRRYARAVLGAAMPLPCMLGVAGTLVALMCGTVHVGVALLFWHCLPHSALASVP